MYTLEDALEESYKIIAYQKYLHTESDPHWDWLYYILPKEQWLWQWSCQLHSCVEQLVLVLNQKVSKPCNPSVA